MLQIGSILMSSLLLFCMVATPTSRTVDQEICYQDTAFYNDTVAPLANTSISISYTSRTLLGSHSLAIRYPCYDYAPAVGACASVAGGNVVGFYDRYDENLIPNHTSGTPIVNSFSYAIQDSAVEEVITQLYHYMGPDTVGTTEAEFISGLTNFCKDKGKSISFSSCMKSGSFNFSAAQSYLKLNQPIILFLSGYNVGSFFEYENKDTMSYYVSEANHIMVGFGYRIYSYTTTSGNISCEYISVASGVVGYSSGFYNINYKTKINDALAVNIY